MKVRYLVVPLLLSTIPAWGQTLCAPAATQCGTGSPPALRPVFEIIPQTPNEPFTYELNSQPSPRGILRVTRGDGDLELIPMSDYTITGKVIRLIGPNAEVGSNEVRAAYSVEGYQAPVSPSRKATSTAQQESATVLDRFLERSLYEATGSPNESATGVNVHTTTNTPRSNDSRPKVPSSFRMLSRAIQRKDDEPVDATSRNTNKRAKVTPGLEGLGDVYLTGPFDLLAAAPGGLTANLPTLGAPSVGRSYAPGSSRRNRTPRSLVMLQNNISASK